jgi:hypothetical protein
MRPVAAAGIRAATGLSARAPAIFATGTQGCPPANAKTASPGKGGAVFEEVLESRSVG